MSRILYIDDDWTYFFLFSKNQRTLYIFYNVHSLYSCQIKIENEILDDNLSILKELL